MKILKKIIPIFLIICVIFGLSACSDTKKSDITIAELLEQNAKVAQYNYRQATVQSVKLTISGEMMNLEMNSSTVLQTDVYDEDHIKTETVTRSSMTPGTEKTVSYIVDDDVYLSTYEDNDTLPISIKASRKDMNVEDVSLSELTDEKVFEKATIVFNTKTNTYDVTVDMSNLLDYVSLDDLFGMDYDDGESLADDADTYARMLEEFSKTKMVYKYNKSYELVSVTVEDLTYMYEDPTFGKMTMTMSFDITFSDYGKVTAKDVEVPKEILDAVQLDEVLGNDATVDGWIIAEDKTVTEELLAIYNEVAGEDNPYKPTQLLATQISNGVNYLFLIEDENGNEGLIGIYKASDGKLYLLDSSLIPSDFIPKN